MLQLQHTVDIGKEECDRKGIIYDMDLSKRYIATTSTHTVFPAFSSLPWQGSSLRPYVLKASQDHLCHPSPVA